MKRTNKNKNLSISLFAGIGGFDHGLSLAGIQTSIANDFFGGASKTFRRNFPETNHIQFDLYQLNNLDIISNFINQQKSISSTEDHNHSGKKKYNNGISIVTGGFPCFKAGTMVLTKDGYKDIKDVLEGDFVLTHTNQYKKVLTKMTTLKKQGIYKLVIEKTEDTYATSEHPYYVLNKETKKYEWIHVENLKVGDLIGSYNNGSFNSNYMVNKRVLDIEFINEENTVYNIEVEDDNSYTANNCIVHNCQPFSQAGSRKGIDDEIDSVKGEDGRIRGRLYLEMIKVINKQQPKMFIAENVSGLVSMNKGETLKLIINDFEDLGYNVSYELLDMSKYGVPQKRKRIFIVGIRKDLNKTFEFPKSLYEQHKSLMKELDLEIIEDEKQFEFNVIDSICDLQSTKELENLTIKELERYEEYKNYEVSTMYSLLMKSKTNEFAGLFKQYYSKGFFDIGSTNIKIDKYFDKANDIINDIFELLEDINHLNMDILNIQQKIEQLFLELMNIEMLFFGKYGKDQHFKSTLEKVMSNDTFRLEANRKPNNEVFNVFNVIPCGEKSGNAKVQVEIAKLGYVDKNGNPKKHSFAGGYKRFNGKNPGLTITCGHGTELHPYLNRTLNVYELKRIQSFDDGFQILGSRTEQEVQLGNSITPIGAYFIFKDILKYL